MPDAELIVCNYLRAALNSRSESYTQNVYVGNEVPGTRRDRMVIVTRAGGSRKDLISDAPLIRLWIWAKTPKDANDLTNMVRALLPLMADGSPVVFVSENSGPVKANDPAVPAEQRLMTYQINMRGSAA